MSLVYNGTTIDHHSLPPPREDQDALRATLQAQAERFNRDGYAPDLQVQQDFVAPKPQPEADFSYLL